MVSMVTCSGGEGGLYQSLLQDGDNQEQRYLEGMSYIQYQVVNINRSPGKEERQAEEDQHQVSLLPSRHLPGQLGSVGHVGQGHLGREGPADPGVDDSHCEARYEVLDSEACEGVGKMVRLLRPVL